MKIFRPLAITMLAIILAACGSTHLASAHKAGVSKGLASASALATSPAALQAERAAIRNTLACGRSTQTVTSIQYTLNPFKVSGAHFTRSAGNAPIKGMEALVRCLHKMYHGLGLRWLSCSGSALSNAGAGKGVFGRDAAALIGCLATAEAGKS